MITNVIQRWFWLNKITCLRSSKSFIHFTLIWRTDFQVKGLHARLTQYNKQIQLFSCSSFCLVNCQYLQMSFLFIWRIFQKDLTEIDSDRKCSSSIIYYFVNCTLLRHLCILWLTLVKLVLIGSFMILYHGLLKLALWYM